MADALRDARAGLAELERGLAALLEAIADASASPERLARAEQALGADPWLALERARAVASDAELADLDRTVRRIAELRAIALRTAEEQRDGVLDALKRTRTALAGLRRLGAVRAGDTCDVRG